MPAVETIRQTLPAGSLLVSRFAGWQSCVGPLLERACLGAAVRESRQVLIKPNLVEALAPPITTPVELVAEIAAFIRDQAPGVRVLVGDGCGAKSYDTWRVFGELGYTEMAARFGIELVDLNEAPLVRLSRNDCKRWPEMHLPKLLFESLLISVPVLKAHTLAGVTLTMKNMMGTAPPLYYQQGGHWKKAAFHRGIQEAILDLNRYRTPDFTLLDATVGMAEAHLYGPTCSPPPNRLVAAADPVAVDAYGAELLCRPWQEIGHIRQADGVLGQAAPLAIEELD